MKVMVTGGSGFVGRALVKRLVQRGDDVVCLVRSPSKAEALKAMGVRFEEGDLENLPAIQRAMQDVDQLYHIAGVYQLGSVDRHAMFQANVIGTTNVLGCAKALGVPRSLYTSSVMALGNTHGTVADETLRHDRHFRSHYEFTKFMAHQEAMRLARTGLPLVTVLPGPVYGPGDHSALGRMIMDFIQGKPSVRIATNPIFTMVHVDDLAEGIIAAMEQGDFGQAYTLTGDVLTMDELFETLSRLTGRPAPRLALPLWFLFATAWLTERCAQVLKQEPWLVVEGVRWSDGATWNYSSEKAKMAWGWNPRPLEDGLKSLLD